MTPVPQFLLVNDDDDGLFLLERAVKRDFPEAVVFKTKSPMQALEFCATQKFDAIITDNRMPEMDGLAMVQKIRARDAVTPILMLTGSHQLEAEAMRAGASDFVSTGSWEDIRQRIRRLMGEG